MQEIDWSQIRYFDKEEFAHPDKLSPRLIYKLDELRQVVGAPCIVHSDYRKGDAGYHGRGQAVDFHFKGLGQPGTLLRLFDLAMIAKDIGIHGIGMYLDWNSPGLHIDLRPESKKAYWVHTRHGYHYI